MPIAAHRSTTGNWFGWHSDGYLGRLRQLNPWTDSGHEFFAEYRLLRFLREPGVEQALTTADRRALERLCARLAEVIPEMPAVLTHGDRFFELYQELNPSRPILTVAMWHRYGPGRRIFTSRRHDGYRRTYIAARESGRLRASAGSRVRGA